MSSKLGVLGLVCGGLLIVACQFPGSARVVKRTQTGGTLALEGDRNKAMQDASGQMTAHCQGPYQIVEEGEAVVGTDTVAGEDTAYDEGGSSTTKQQSTRQATEYRITYVCGGGDAPPPAGPPGPPPGDPPPQ